MKENVKEIISEIEYLSKKTMMSSLQIAKELTRFFYLKQYSDGIDEYMYSSKDVYEIVKDLGISTKKFYILLKKRGLPKKRELRKKKRRYLFYLKKEQKQLEDKKLPELISKIEDLSKSSGISEMQLSEELKDYFYSKKMDKAIQDYKKGDKKVLDILKELNVSPKIFYRALKKNKITKKYSTVKTNKTLQ